MGRDSIPVRRPDSQSREPGFKSHCGRFEPLASLITPRCHSSLSCINEYLAIQTVVDMWTNSLRAAIASQRSWDSLGMNRSARGWSVKRFEQSYGPDTALYKNIPLLYWMELATPLFSRLPWREGMTPQVSVGRDDTIDPGKKGWHRRLWREWMAWLIPARRNNT